MSSLSDTFNDLTLLDIAQVGAHIYLGIAFIGAVALANEFRKDYVARRDQANLKKGPQ